MASPPDDPDDDPHLLLEVALDGAHPPSCAAAWCGATGALAVALLDDDRRSSSAPSSMMVMMGGGNSFPSSSGRALSRPASTEVAVLDLERPQDHSILRLAGCPEPVSHLSWCPPGSGVALATGTDSGKVVVWTPLSSSSFSSSPPPPLNHPSSPSCPRWVGTPLPLDSGSSPPRLAALRWLQPPNGWRWRGEREEGGEGTDEAVMVESLTFGPLSEDAQGAEHWASAGATALAAVSSSEGGWRVVVWWAGPEGGWNRSQATAPCCRFGEEREEKEREEVKTPSPAKAGGAGVETTSSPSTPPLPPPLLAADVAAAADGSLRVLTLQQSSSRGSCWSGAEVVAFYGDPTAVSDSGRALSPWSPPCRVGGCSRPSPSSSSKKKEGSSSLLLAPAPGSRAFSSRPLTAVFVPGTGGASVLLAGVGEEEGEGEGEGEGGTLFVVRLDCSFGKRRARNENGDDDDDDDDDKNPGFIAPPRLEDARWIPVATWEVPPAGLGEGEGEKAGAEKAETEAALLSVSPEGATALVRAGGVGGGGLFALDLNSFSSPPRPVPAPSPTIAAAFSPTGECAATVGSSGSVVVLPAAAEATSSSVSKTATATKAKNKSSSSSSSKKDDSDSSAASLARAAARRLCWALTNNLSPLGPALLLSAAGPRARREALSLLQRAVALHPWATRPAVASSASRAAAAVCRLARSRCSAAALADSPEAVLEFDLMAELRVGDLDVAVRAALVSNSSSSSTSTAAAAAPAAPGNGNPPPSSRPLPSLAASDALLLAPAVAWAEALALWLLLSARHWARRRRDAEEAAAAAAASAKGANEEEQRKAAADLLFAASVANHTPGVRLLASTGFLGALRQAVATGLTLPAEAAEEAERWLRGALSCCCSRSSPSSSSPAAENPPPPQLSWLASWSLAAPRGTRLRALAASLAEVTGREAPTAAEIDVAGATARLVLGSAGSLSSLPEGLLSSFPSSFLELLPPEPLAAPLSRAGGPVDPRKVLGLFGDEARGKGSSDNNKAPPSSSPAAAPPPGLTISSWADSTPEGWLLRLGERPPPRPPAPFSRAPLGISLRSSPSSPPSKSSSFLVAAAAARSTGAAALPPLPSDHGAGALAPFVGAGGSGSDGGGEAGRRRWAGDRAGAAVAAAASASASNKRTKTETLFPPSSSSSSPSEALGPTRQPQRQRLDALTWRPLEPGAAAAGGGGSSSGYPALVSSDGGSVVSASTVAAAAAAASSKDLSGVLMFGSWGAAAPPAGGGWFAA